MGLHDWLESWQKNGEDLRVFLREASRQFFQEIIINVLNIVPLHQLHRSYQHAACITTSFVYMFCKRNIVRKICTNEMIIRC
jgi:hypothetical protein